MALARKGSDNLIPARTRTAEERRENARKAGIASGVVRKQRKALKETLNVLLSLPVKNTKDWNALSKMGFDPDEGFDNSMLVVLGLFQKAKLGDVNAIRELRNIIGEETTSETLLEAKRLLGGVDSAF